MPTGRKQDGEHAMSNAERQARYRARHTANPSPIASRPRCIPDRRSRPQRWQDAINELIRLQAEYADWPRGVAGQSSKQRRGGSAGSHR